MKPWLLVVIALAGILAVVLTSLNPINSTGKNLISLVALSVTWIAFGLLLRKKRRWFIVASVLVVGVFLTPGRNIDRESLLNRYEASLVSFDQTQYRWGGESSRGIDCSGLPRRALRNALLGEAFSKANPSALRYWLEQWWFDASARAMRDEYRNFTFPVGITGKISEMESGKINPGDLAVTQSGMHVLAYLGEDVWIQADPGIGAVAILNGKTDENSWFESKVSIHRWSVFK